MLSPVRPAYQYTSLSKPNTCTPRCPAGNPERTSNTPMSPILLPPLDLCPRQLFQTPVPGSFRFRVPLVISHFTYPTKCVRRRSSIRLTICQGYLSTCLRLPKNTVDIMSATHGSQMPLHPCRRWSNGVGAAEPESFARPPEDLQKLFRTPWHAKTVPEPPKTSRNVPSLLPADLARARSIASTL